MKKTIENLEQAQNEFKEQLKLLNETFVITIKDYNNAYNNELKEATKENEKYNQLVVANRETNKSKLMEISNLINQCSQRFLGISAALLQSEIDKKNNN